MKEIPIIMTGDSVRAILAGRKTQTRRVASTREPLGYIGPRGEEADPANWGWFFERPHRHGYMVLARGLDEERRISIPCPYGEPGDRLWVKETWQAWHRVSHEYDEWEPITAEARFGVGWAEFVEQNGKPDSIQYKATSESSGPWTSPLYMPRWASRISLEVTQVRVQRLHEITEADAIAEGAREFHDIPDPHPYKQGARWSMAAPTNTDECLNSARLAYANAWNVIHGGRNWNCNGKPEPWTLNPWVWAVTFARIDAHGDRT